MRNTIRIISFAVFALIFGMADAKAQSLRSAFEAEIPFEFAIGKKSFAPGTYKLRISGEPNGIKFLEIRDSQRDVLYRGLMVENGERLENSAVLKFESSTGKLSLAKIAIPGAGFTMREKSKATLLAVSKKPTPVRVTN
jgi:hypothetical protein